MRPASTIVSLDVLVVGHEGSVELAGRDPWAPVRVAMSMTVSALSFRAA